MMRCFADSRVKARLVDFFFLPASPAPLAILRICIGLLLLYQAIVLAPFTFELFGRDAFVQGDLAQYLSNPHLPSIKTFLNAFWPLGLVESQVMVGIGVAYTLSLLCMIVGYRTRIATPLAWLLHLTLMNTAPCSNYGADQFLHISLFYLMLSPCGDAFSVTALTKRGVRTTEARFWLRLLQLHLCIAYLASGLEKSAGDQWWNGEVIWRALNLPVYAQFDVSWLAPHSGLLKLAAWGTLVIEIGYPLFIWLRKTRLVWVTLVASLHLGIAVLLGLGVFGLTMLSLTVCAFGLPLFFERNSYRLEKPRSPQ
ncbi:HTTM domain-containing protein [bacterium]|nr:HTTM domain-containing protein [bacterium]